MMELLSPCLVAIARSSRARCLSIAGLLLLLAVPVLAGSPEERKTLSVSYKFPPFLLETNGEDIRLTPPDGGQLHRVGEPAMPFRTARVLLPPGYTVEKAEAQPTQ